MNDMFMVFRGDDPPRFVSGAELADLIDEDDAPRFLEYSVPGDFYEYGNLVVVRLGRRFVAP